jgi:hypothetical protein
MAVSFARDIRPLFTDMDIAHMKDLGVLQEVHRPGGLVLGHPAGGARIPSARLR